MFGLFGTNTCYLDDGKLFIVCKKRLKILNFIHLVSTFALQAESSTGDSLDKYLCVFVWRNLHFAKSFSFLSSSLISFSQIHFIEDKSNAMQERQDCNGCYCINVKTLSFPFSATWVTRHKISRDSQLIIRRLSSWRTTNSFVADTLPKSQMWVEPIPPDSCKNSKAANLVPSLKIENVCAFKI